MATVELKKSVVINKPQAIPTQTTEKTQLPSGENNKSEAMRLATDIIARHEGFHAKSYRDHKGWSIGYGTRGKQGEVISKQEGWNRMYAIVGQLYTKVVQDFPTLSDNQHAALISLKYNCHSGYMRLVRSGITEARFKSCNSTSGKVLRGLVTRRQSERNLYLGNQ